MEDETAILDSPIGERDRQKARRLANGLGKSFRKFRLAGAGHSMKQHVHGSIRGKEALQDAGPLKKRSRKEEAG